MDSQDYTLFELKQLMEGVTRMSLGSCSFHMGTDTLQETAQGKSKTLGDYNIVNESSLQLVSCGVDMNVKNPHVRPRRMMIK